VGRGFADRLRVLASTLPAQAVPELPAVDGATTRRAGSGTIPLFNPNACD